MAVSPWNIRLPAGFRLFGRFLDHLVEENHKKPGFPSNDHLSTGLWLVNAFLDANSLCVSMACSELQSLNKQFAPKLCFISGFEIGHTSACTISLSHGGSGCIVQRTNR
jgi:hypothetical protein